MKEKTKISWTALRYENETNNIQLQIGLAFITGCILVGSIVFKNYLLGIIIVISAILIKYLKKDESEYIPIEIDNRGIRPSTIRTYYNKIVAFIRWLEYYNQIEGKLSSKMTKPTIPKYEDERALTDDEVSKIIASITLYSRRDDFLYARDLVIISLLIYTGIRRGELLGLRISDIDFQTNTLFINGKTSKSKKSRYIPIHFSLLTQLKLYLKEREKRKTQCEMLIVSSQFDTPYTVHGLKSWVKKYAELSSVRFHLHRFRHTFACKLAKQNADIVSIMNVMGHSTTRMTEQYLRSIKAENSRVFIQNMTF